ncbi:RagB/SusD family nutrient uptake outer membrane protein [Bacteroides caecigallinarum]|uniref:RagB/SusD family nutrient uptake outer membrane protein n=1 Tax=uncultured Bacteroides sp. TaxID=162156 RepID=UPI00259732B2|nr:RagB/SusD family nutrient uptake outer membrane protein [uncultured Bacteroides sp.]MDN0053052.1 RagB/SusD family nutrient uptake outer membrane protein [Bacteroides caecigallinarum]MDN0072440.1 RagB/SusD family nutrient uptake outer membrane protein [Bacteroides caecigallinarum]
MKRYIYISLFSVSLIGLVSSCDLEAPSKSSMDSSVIFSTPSLAEGAVMGIHQSFGETNSYRGRYLPYYGLNSDVEWINGMDPTKMPDAGKYDLCTYASTATNTQMNTTNNAYAKFYEGIERANQAIVGLRAYGDVENNSTMAQLLGEALTLRAVLYLDLVKGWGDVPARFEPITTETMYVGRSDRDIIYKQLLSDLEEASTLVAWPNETSVTKSVERVNKAFTKGLRARVALYAGGYSQRADGIRLSNDPELSREAMYTIARDECLEVIAHCPELSKLAFKDNFLRLCQDDVTAGAESLWEIPFSDGRGRVLYTFGVKHNAADQYTQQAQGGVNGPLPYLFYDYDVEDIRRDITCVPYDWSKELDNGRSKQQLRSLSKWCFGKLRYEWMNRIVTSTNDDGVNWQYMRLADVYLMAAEAINELSTPADAAQYLKPILDRALPADKVTAYMATATASKDAFFNAIVDQRAFEFAGECLRKADLIRWNLLKTKLDEAKDKMRKLARREAPYNDLPEKLYYETAEDGETLIIYGLNHGDTDEEGEALGYESNTTWISTTKLEDSLIDVLYTQNPDENQVWPIWQTFIDSSNGMLTNE